MIRYEQTISPCINRQNEFRKIEGLTINTNYLTTSDNLKRRPVVRNDQPIELVEKFTYVKLIFVCLFVCFKCYMNDVSIKDHNYIWEMQTIYPKGETKTG